MSGRIHMAMRLIALLLICLAFPGHGFLRGSSAKEEASSVMAKINAMSDAEAKDFIEHTLEDNFGMTEEQAEQTIKNYEQLMSNAETRQVLDNFEAMMTEDDAKRIITNYEHVMSHGRHVLNGYEKMMSEGQTRHVISQYQQKVKQHNAQQISQVDMTEDQAKQVIESVLENTLHVPKEVAEQAINNYEKLMSDDNTRTIITNFENMMTEDDALRIINNYEDMMRKQESRQMISNYAQIMNKGNARHVINNYKKSKPAQPMPIIEAVQPASLIEQDHEEVILSEPSTRKDSLKIISEYERTMSEDDARQIIRDYLRSDL